MDERVVKKKERYGHIELLKEIGVTDEHDFLNYFRMDVNKFYELIIFIFCHPDIKINIEKAYHYRQLKLIYFHFYSFEI